MGFLRFLAESPCYIDRDIAAGIQDLRPMISYEVYYFLRDERVMPDPFLFKSQPLCGCFFAVKNKNTASLIFLTKLSAAQAPSDFLNQGVIAASFFWLWMYLFIVSIDAPPELKMR